MNDRRIEHVCVPGSSVGDSRLTAVVMCYHSGWDPLSGVMEQTLHKRTGSAVLQQQREKSCGASERIAQCTNKERVSSDRVAHCRMVCVTLKKACFSYILFQIKCWLSSLVHAIPIHSNSCAAIVTVRKRLWRLNTT